MKGLREFSLSRRKEKRVKENKGDLNRKERNYSVACSRSQ